MCVESSVLSLQFCCEAKTSQKKVLKIQEMRDKCCHLYFTHREIRGKEVIRIKLFAITLQVINGVE